MQPSVITVTLNPAIDKTIILSDFKIGELNRVDNLRIDPGGKGINVAKVLHDFGVDVLATGFIAGNQGQYIIMDLQTKGIKADFLEISGETRTNLKIVDDKSRITTEINEQGFEVTPQDLESFSKKLDKKLKKDSILVIGGSLPTGAPSVSYKEFIEMAAAKGTKVILDADGDAFKEGIKGKPFAVKPNVHELEQFLDRSLQSDKEILSAGKQLLEMGISLVIISMGSKGAMIMDHQEAIRVTTFPITAKSTVGAGDSMVAALVYSLINKKNLEEIAAWTTTAGTVTASKSGTQVCSLREVEEAVSKVKCLKL